MHQNKEYVTEIHLKNVRKHEDETFDFNPGFNLLVGENGAGKSSILRAILSTLSEKYPSKKYGLQDEDITHQSKNQRVLVKLNTDKKFEYRREYGSRAIRNRKPKRPLVISYFADEAICSHFQTKNKKRLESRNDDVDHFTPKSLDNAESWMHNRMSQIVNLSDYGTPDYFGSPESIKQFIRNILHKFSDKFIDFEWLSIPYSTTIQFPNSFTSESMEDQKFLKILKREVKENTTKWVLRDNISDISQFTLHDKNSSGLNELIAF